VRSALVSVTATCDPIIVVGRAVDVDEVEEEVVAVSRASFMLSSCRDATRPLIGRSQPSNSRTILEKMREGIISEIKPKVSNEVGAQGCLRMMKARRK
jgi:hypothetical protein